jgi:hypothetical protein
MSEQDTVSIPFDNIHQIWIEPELIKRETQNTLPKDFKIFQCLVLLPTDGPPIVNFNEEIKWVIKVKNNGYNLKVGDPVYPHHIYENFSVEPPQIEGKKVAFIFLFWNGTGYKLCFDFSPNLPEDLSNQPEEWYLGRYIAEYLKLWLTEKIISSNSNIQEELKKIGLWVAPSLLPYPISQILKQILDQNITGAQKTLVEFCTVDFIRSLSEKWFNIDAFSQRKQLINEAIFAHENKLYHLSINTLLPQLEGIITDWEYSIKNNQGPVLFRVQSKIKNFTDIVSSSNNTYIHHSIVNSTNSFLLEGFMLTTFKNWTDPLDVSFPNRHAITHGRYEKDLYTVENSIKVFLLLDTISHIILESRLS